jgi:MFS family permease
MKRNKVPPPSNGTTTSKTAEQIFREDATALHGGERTGLLLSNLQDRDDKEVASTLRNFVLMSVLLSTVPAAALACLALATAQLGSVGAWQSGVLYLTYTLSAVLGATYIVKRYGSRDALVMGMMLYCIYVGCFFLATMLTSWRRPLALSGAAFGGIGAGIMWTAQGTYLTHAAEVHALASDCHWDDSTSKLAGIFAFVLLAEETAMDLLSTVLAQGGILWIVIFALFSVLALLSTTSMVLVKKYPIEEEEQRKGLPSLAGVFYKATAALRLLLKDPKMKYMIGINAAFGFAGAFLNSFVNGEVVPLVLSESYVGLLVAIHGGAAAVFSVVFAYLAKYTGKGPILIGGAFAFASVALPFLVQPDLSKWTWLSVCWVYVLGGIGRATFEGNLKALFSDYFSYEREGAYANIILQNGLSSAIAYVLSIRLTCSIESAYCIRYQMDGSLHNILAFGSLVVAASLLAILGYWRAAVLYHSGDGRDATAAHRQRSISSYRNSRTSSALLDPLTYAALHAIVGEES